LCPPHESSFYFDTVQPLASVQKDGNTIAARRPGRRIFPGVASTFRWYFLGAFAYFSPRTGEIVRHLPEGQAFAAGLRFACRSLSSFAPQRDVWLDLGRLPRRDIA
jgi:hypothetical protein